MGDKAVAPAGVIVGEFSGDPPGPATERGPSRSASCAPSDAVIAYGDDGYDQSGGAGVSSISKEKPGSDAGGEGGDDGSKGGGGPANTGGGGGEGGDGTSGEGEGGGNGGLGPSGGGE